MSRCVVNFMSYMCTCECVCGGGGRGRGGREGGREGGEGRERGGVREGSGGYSGESIHCSPLGSFWRQTRLNLVPFPQRIAQTAQ